MTTAVLGDWVDPDGDPFFLQQATVEAPDAVSSTAEGVVVFDEAAAAAEPRTSRSSSPTAVTQAVGHARRSTVREPGDVPLIADPFVALATAGQEIRIDPLRHVRGGIGHRPAQRGAREARRRSSRPTTIAAPSASRATRVRTHYLEYTVTDGTKTATGVVRVDVSAPPDRDTTPITVPHTAFLRAEQPVDVDVLATDIDPTGGVLVVTGVDEPSSGARACRSRSSSSGCCGSRSTRPLDDRVEVFGYRVSNGLAEAEGEVTLVEVPPPDASPNRRWRHPT